MGKNNYLKYKFYFSLYCFILAELLVVKATRSILAGMLMPALETTIGSARKISYSKPVKQQEIMFFSYTDNYSRYIPEKNAGNSSDGYFWNGVE